MENDIYLVSDEIYEKLVYDGYKNTSIASLGGPIKDKTIIAHGCTKTYSMTGWRIGFAAGPREVIRAMAAIQSQSTSNPTSIAQWAAVAALTGPQDPVQAMVKEFAKRRDVFVSGLNAMEGVTCYNPKGAFYVFPSFKGLMGRTYKGKKVTSDAQWTEILLEDFHTAVVPGGEFGKEGYIRLSFATSMEVIEKGIERIRKAIKALD